MKCVAGCKRYTGHETKHHRACPFYPGSFSKRFDDLQAEIEKYRWIPTTERLPEKDIPIDIIVDITLKSGKNCKRRICDICWDETEAYPTSYTIVYWKYVNWKSKE